MLTVVAAFVFNSVILWRHIQFASNTGAETMTTKLSPGAGAGAAAAAAGNQASVRTCLLFYDGLPNYEAIKAWIEYHHKRWGLSHVDMFVTEKMSDMRDILNYAFQDLVKIQVFYTHLHEKPVLKHYFGQRQTVMMNRVLQNAKLDNNSFVLFMDPDEFLVSEDFQNIEEMFAGGHDGVTFPVFGIPYGYFCSNKALVYGSLGYQALTPTRTNSSTNASLDYYSDPAQVACSGGRKYIVRTDKWDRVNHVHDPIDCSRKEKDNRVLDLSGRRQDGQHARLLHVRSGVGIHSDLSMRACRIVRSCNFLTGSGECTDETKGDAVFRREDSEVTELLKDRPLFPDLADMYPDAVCYAERNPTVLEKVCKYDITNCPFGALLEHFETTGRQNNLTWGCKVYEQ